MADKTFGVKVNEDLHDKVQGLIENSSLTAKDWFEKAVSLVEFNSVKEGSVEYSQDLNELEAHTTRIFELVANMVQRSIYLKEDAIKELSMKVEQKDTIISEYQNKIKEVNEEKELLKQSTTELEEIKEILTKQLEEARSSSENNQNLIIEYKNKIDSLSGLISKYQSFADENEKLKINFLKIKSELEKEVNDLNNQYDGQKNECIELKKTIEHLKKNHKDVLEQTIIKKDYEKDRALLELEKTFQKEIVIINQNYNNEIKKYLDQSIIIRKEYEDKLDLLNKKIAEKEK